MDTRRLILVLIFTFSSFMLWESWQKYNQPKPAANAVATTTPGSAAPTPSVSLQPGSTGSAAPVVSAAAIAPVGETFIVSTDLLKATISAQGGDLVELELLRYKEHGNKDKNFFLFEAKHQYMAQSGLIGEGLPTHRSIFKRVEGAKFVKTANDGWVAMVQHYFVSAWLPEGDVQREFFMPGRWVTTCFRRA
jgi:YidC/Oxa1 family membrane protein insertase